MANVNITKDDAKALAELCGPGGKYDLDTEAGRKAMAVKVLKRIQLEVAAFDIVPFVLDVDNSFSVGDTIQWWDLDGLTVYQHEPGGVRPKSKVVKKTFTATPDFYSVTAVLHWVDRMSGRYGSVAGIQSMMRDRLVGEKSKKLWDLMKSTVTSSHANYASSSGDLAKADLDLAIKTISDKGKRPRAILGRRLALDKILDFGTAAGVDFSEDAKRSIEQTGSLGVYRGVPIVAFPEFQDENDVALIDNQNVFVVADGVGRLAPLDGVGMNQWVDNETQDWNISMHEYYAMALLDVSRSMFRIEIT